MTPEIPSYNEKYEDLSLPDDDAFVRAVSDVEDIINLLKSETKLQPQAEKVSVEFKNKQYELLEPNLKLLDMALKSITRARRLVATDQIPTTQKERDKIFDEISYHIVDQGHRWGLLGGHLLDLSGYFSVRRPK